MAQAILDPAHAVEYEGIFRRQLERLLDVIACLDQSVGAIGQGVAQRVVRLRIVGLEDNQSPQIDLDEIDAVDFLGSQRNVVEQLGLVRLDVECFSENVE